MWFIVVISNATIPNSNMNEIFVFSNPHFETQTDCYNYVQVMNMDIYAKAAASYGFKYTPEKYIVLTKTSLKNNERV